MQYNDKRKPHIQRANLQVQKLNIDDEATKKIGINRPHKVIASPEQSLMNCNMSNIL